MRKASMEAFLSEEGSPAHFQIGGLVGYRWSGLSAQPALCSVYGGIVVMCRLRRWVSNWPVVNKLWNFLGPRRWVVLCTFFRGRGTRRTATRTAFRTATRTAFRPLQAPTRIVPSNLSFALLCVSRAWFLSLSSCDEHFTISPNFALPSHSLFICARFGLAQARLPRLHLCSVQCSFVICGPFGRIYPSVVRESSLGDFYLRWCTHNFPVALFLTLS